jgi:Protein of unknown function (DUF3300)
MAIRSAKRATGIFCVLLASSVGFSALAQVPVPYAPDSAGSPAPSFLPPEQLDNLVAPVALYPDQLLSQVLAASTYPLEIVEAQQWLQQNSYLHGPQLVDAARQQNWDPSVQALVIFPEVLVLLTRDVQWATALGNAFLAQQKDVMDAIQYMRARAQNNGHLRSTSQEIVTAPAQGGQNPIEIQPADPRIMFVPSYNPQSVWGPPAQGYYPQVGDSSSGYTPGSSIGQFFGSVVNLASYFIGFGGLVGGGWGWALNWLTHSVLLNSLFFNMFGLHSGNSYSGGGYGAPSVWVHDPGHRWGVPYSNHEVAARFGGAYSARNVAFNSRGNMGGGHYDVGRYNGDWRTSASDRIGSQQGWRNPASTRSFSNSFAASNFGSVSRGFASPGYSSAGYSSAANHAPNYPRAYERDNGANGYKNSPAPGGGWFARNVPSLRASNQHLSEPRSQERFFSVPRQSSQHFSAPHVSRFHGSSGHNSGGHGLKGHGSSGHSHKH